MFVPYIRGHGTRKRKKLLRTVERPWRAEHEIRPRGCPLEEPAVQRATSLPQGKREGGVNKRNGSKGDLEVGVWTLRWKVAGGIRALPKPEASRHTTWPGNSSPSPQPT